MVEWTRTFEGATGAEVPIQLKAGERAFGVFEGAALVEPRRERGTFQAGSAGVSFRVMKGVTLRTGSTRGSYAAGAERPTAIDVGTLTITNKRVVFQGPKQAREWAFSKLLGVQHDPNEP